MRWLALLGWAAWSAVAAATGAEATVRLYTIEWPPYSFRSSAAGSEGVAGISADIVRMAIVRAKVAVTAPSIQPWARALASTRSTPGSCLFPVGRTPERELQYQWAGPIGLARWTLFARSADHVAIGSVEEARPYQIGAVIGDMSVNYFERRGFKLSVAPSDTANLMKLQRGRIGLWSSERLAALALIRDSKQQGVVPVLDFASVEWHIACNLETPAATVEALERALRDMQADGSIAAIHLRYGAGPKK
jgi:polar amino acid transport system substrate-binding protein